MKVSLHLLAAAGLLAITGPAATTPIDCRAPGSAAEKALCGSDLLSRLDERAQHHYGALRAITPDPQRGVLEQDHARFLEMRDACVSDRICLTTTYLTRIEDLTGRLRQVRLARLTP